MRSIDSPDELSSDERLRELACILAAGILRLQKLRVLGGLTAETLQKTSAESATGRLEVSGETVLSVQSG